MDYFVQVFAEAGLEPAPGHSAADWMRKAGAVDVHEQVLSFPVGIKTATPEVQTSTTTRTANLCNIIDNFATIGRWGPVRSLQWLHQHNVWLLNHEN